MHKFLLQLQYTQRWWHNSKTIFYITFDNSRGFYWETDKLYTF